MLNGDWNLYCMRCSLTTANIHMILFRSHYNNCILLYIVWIANTYEPTTPIVCLHPGCSCHVKIVSKFAQHVFTNKFVFAIGYNNMADLSAMSATCGMCALLINIHPMIWSVMWLKDLPHGKFWPSMRWTIFVVRASHPSLHDSTTLLRAASSSIVGTSSCRYLQWYLWTFHMLVI